MEYLIVVDMQHDFVDGALGTQEARAIVPMVKELFEGFDGKVIFTRDTHEENYLQTQEGRLLPVEHCIKGSRGWELCYSELPQGSMIFDKGTFAGIELGEYLKKADDVTGITLVGLCTDICVVSNALMLKGLLSEIPIRVIERCCAGTSPERHRCALETIKSCQIICE